MHGFIKILLFCPGHITILAESMVGQVQQLDFEGLLHCFGFPQDVIQAVMDNEIYTTSDLIGIDATDIKNVTIHAVNFTPQALES
jgi:hypothetical protein